MTQTSVVPSSLRAWFIVHFVVDMLFAIPLFFFPVEILHMFGWTAIDPLAARLVASAFFAIGGTSLLIRNASVSVYLMLLDLKLIWSVLAMMGIAISLWQGAPLFSLVAFGIFFVFFCAWTYYRQHLGSNSREW